MWSSCGRCNRNFMTWLTWVISVFCCFQVRLSRTTQRVVSLTIINTDHSTNEGYFPNCSQETHDLLDFCIIAWGILMFFARLHNIKNAWNVSDRLPDIGHKKSSLSFSDMPNHLVGRWPVKEAFRAIDLRMSLLSVARSAMVFSMVFSLSLSLFLSPFCQCCHLELCFCDPFKLSFWR